MSEMESVESHVNGWLLGYTNEHYCSASMLGSIVEPEGLSVRGKMCENTTGSQL